MCQLLGMSCKLPATINFSFEGFATRAGQTDTHIDGWGIAFFEDEGCRVFIDTLPAMKSPIAELIKRYPIKSRYVVAHIRRATEGSGGVALQNCHPFQRELWGRMWIFAHNGQVNSFLPQRQASDVYTPIGETDSERAFCYMLNRLRARFPEQPSVEVLTDAVAELAAEISEYGTFNFLLSSGSFLLAYCTTSLHFVTRRYPFTTIRLIDCDMQIDLSKHNHVDDVISVIATKPLTANEQWQALVPGELRVFVNGQSEVQRMIASPRAAAFPVTI